MREYIWSWIESLFLIGHCPFHRYEYDCRIDRGECTLCHRDFCRWRLEHREDFHHMQGVYTLSQYIEPAFGLIHEMKWQNPRLIPHIADLMIYYYCKYIKECYHALTYIPSYISEDRAWSPSYILAKNISKALKIPLIEVFCKTEPSRLYQLNKQERIMKLSSQIYQIHHNINSLHQIAQQYPAANILIIDDLIASGLSLEYCAGLLKGLYPEFRCMGYTFASSRA